MNPLSHHVALHLARLRAVKSPRLEGPKEVGGARFWILYATCPLCLGPEMAIYNSQIDEPWLASCGWCAALLVVRGERLTPMLFEALLLPTGGEPLPLSKRDIDDDPMQMLVAEQVLRASPTPSPLAWLVEVLFWVKCALEAESPLDALARAEVLALTRSEMSDRHLTALAHPTPPDKMGWGAPECWRVVLDGDQKVDTLIAVELVGSIGMPILPLPSGRYWHAAASIHGVLLEQMSDERRVRLGALAHGYLAGVGEGDFLAWPSRGAVHLFRRMSDDEQHYLVAPQAARGPAS